MGNSLLTGQREAAGLGLYYYGARWYDPALGRFIGCPLGADTIVPNPGDAQSFDRYAYVNNNPLKYSDPSGHYAVCFNEGMQPGSETDSPNLETVVNTLCSQLAAQGLFGPSGRYGLFGSNREGAAAARAFLAEMQGLYPDEEFVLIGYSWGGGAAIEFARSLDPILGRQTIIDTMVTIDPVVGGRWWADRQIQVPMVYWYPLPLNNVNRAINILAAQDRYGVVFPWDQGVKVPGAENHVLPGTNHCSVGHARCKSQVLQTVENWTGISMPDWPNPFPNGNDNGEVNPQTQALIVDYLSR